MESVLKSETRRKAGLSEGWWREKDSEPSKAEPSDLQSDPFGRSGNPSTGALQIVLRKMVEGEGFEPSKAEPSDLQSDPFGRSGNPSTGYFPDFCLLGALEWWREKDSNLRRQSRQIYSLIPLAARGTPPKCEAAYYQIRQGCEPLGRILTTKSAERSFFLIRFAQNSRFSMTFYAGSGRSPAWGGLGTGINTGIKEEPHRAPPP